MRKIIVLVDDHGGTKVKIVADEATQSFLTKREFDKALRAAKLAYRQAKREYHRKQVIDRMEKEHGKKYSRVVGIEQQESTGSEISGEETGRDVSRIETAEPVPANTSKSLAGAIAAKAERIRGNTTGTGGVKDAI